MKTKKNLEQIGFDFEEVEKFFSEETLSQMEKNAICGGDSNTACIPPPSFSDCTCTKQDQFCSTQTQACGIK